MALRERFGERDLTYSRWHRSLDPRLHFIDIDSVEYCHRCKQPLVLIELAKDIGQRNKATTVLQRLAAMANLPAYLVFYLAAEDGSGVVRLRVRQVWPAYGEEVMMTPEEYERWLWGFRLAHTCGTPVSKGY